MRLLAATTLAFLCFSQALADDISDVKRLLKERFPKLTFQKVERAPVKGLYEIHAGTNVIYTDRNVEHLIFGEIYTVGGKNLTAERRRRLFKELVAEISKDFPKDAIHIAGKGPSVLLVVDPDCPYCRRLLSYLLDKGADLHIILFGFHQESFPHAVYLLRAEDKKKALREIVSGKLDGKGKEILTSLTEQDRKEVEEKLRGWRNWVNKYDIRGVPFAVVPSKQMVVQGANLRLFDKIFPIDFSQIDLTKAPVVVGNGSGKKVVVVTDPTCPFCRKACNTLRHFAEEGKATFYVFFFPVHGETSIRYISDILNADKKDRPELLKEFFEGKRKPSGKPMNPQAKKEFQEQLQVINKLGVTATPTFIFEDGAKVEGARITQIERKLSK